MADPIATLRTRLTLESAAFEAGAKRAGKGAENLGRAANRAGRQAAGMRRGLDGAAGSTANLAAQFNDIGIMLAAGQSPLQLALQQGTQVNQVLDQMGGTGAQRVRALAASFASIISPANIATIAIIAGAAALVQFGRKAFEAEGDLDGLEKRLETAREKAANLGLELRQVRLGNDATEQAFQDEINRLTTEIREAEERLSKARGQGKRKDALEALQAERAEVEAQLLLYQQQEAEKQRLLETSRETADAERQLGAQMQDTARNTAEVEGIVRLLEQGLDASAIAALELAGVDMASNISAANIEAAKVAANLGIALANAQGMLSALRSAAQDPRIPSMTDPAGRDAAVRARYGQTEGTGLNNNLFPNWDLPAIRTSSRGGSGSGQTAAERELNDLLKERDAILNSLETAYDRYNKQVDTANRLLEMGEITQDQYNQRIADLQEELNSVQFESINRGIEEFSDAIVQAIVDAEDLGEAFSRIVARMIADLASSQLQQGLKSLFGIAFGGSGGFLGTLFNANGNVFNGGKVVPFARGGIVSSATAFPMRGGIGVMGEAGPEAIMPVSRGRNGKMGVQINGGKRVEVVARVENGSIVQDVREIAGPMVQQGIQQYDKQFLPQRVGQINRDPKLRGA